MYTGKHYLRFFVKRPTRIIAGLATILAKHKIEYRLRASEPGHPKSRLPFSITLENAKHPLVGKALQQINALEFLVQPCLHLANSVSGNEFC